MRTQLIHHVCNLLSIMKIVGSLVELLACLDNKHANLDRTRSLRSTQTTVRPRPKSDIRPTTTYNNVREECEKQKL